MAQRIDEIVTYERVRAHPKVWSLLQGANSVLSEMGYTEHGHRHAGIVGDRAGQILEHIARDARKAELARIAGYLHDIGNVVNRINHPMIGATLAFSILDEMGMEPDEIAAVLGAIGNHEEMAGEPISDISAAVIIADKSDVHSTRVQNPIKETFDIHDRVNYAVQHNVLAVDEREKTISLELEIDTSYASVMEFFEIFVSRMVMCRVSALRLGYHFRLLANGTVLE